MKRKEINIEDLVEVLDNRCLKTGFKFNQLTRKNGISTPPSLLYSEGYFGYISKVKEVIKQKQLEGYVVVEDYIQQKKIIEECNSSYVFRHKIIVKNLIINTSSFVNDRIVEIGKIDQIPVHDELRYLKGQKKTGDNEFEGGVYLNFENNIFISRNPQKNEFVCISVGYKSYMNFKNNIFDDIDVFVGHSKHFNLSINLEKNIFNNRHLTISIRDGDQGLHVNGWFLEGSMRNKIETGKKIAESIKKDKKKINERRSVIKKSNTDRILEFLESKFEELHIKPEYLESHITTKNSIVINGNEINELRISSYGNFIFKGKNVINLIESNNLENTFWGAYQKIDPEGKYAYINRDFFIKLKTKAQVRNDALQEKIIQREIIRCEEKIIKKDRFLNSYQDRMIMAIDHHLSSHGILWINPILFLISFNAITTLIAYFLFVEGFDLNILFHVIIESLNPTSNLQDVLQINITRKVDLWVVFLNVSQKIIFGVMVYETIKVARRFSVK